jgi:hypothetical protein
MLLRFINHKNAQEFSNLPNQPRIAYSSTRTFDLIIINCKMWIWGICPLNNLSYFCLPLQFDLQIKAGERNE